MSDRFIYVENMESIMLSDYKYWADKTFELAQWLDKNTVNAKWQGMLIVGITSQEMTMFILKWSGNE